MIPPKPNNFAVATDGSELSRTALQIILREFIGPSDVVTVVSITDKTKTFLREEYRPENIHKIFKNDLVSQLPSSRYKFVMQERSSLTTDVKVDISNIIVAEKCDYLFMGSFGRKGVKWTQKGRQVADRATGAGHGRQDPHPHLPGGLTRSRRTSAGPTTSLPATPPCC